MGWFSSACSAISSACSSVFNSVCSVASGAVALVKEVGSMAVEGIRGLANVICNLARSLGFFREDEDPEDFGDKIIQAGDVGITLESCEGDYNEYMKKIREFKVDSEKSKSISAEDKLAATSVVLGSRIEDHYGTSLAPLVPLIGRMPEFFNSTRIKSLLDAGMSIPKVAGYFNSAFNRKEAAPIEDNLVKNEKVSSPNSDEEQLRNMIRSMRA